MFNTEKRKLLEDYKVYTPYTLLIRFKIYRFFSLFKFAQNILLIKHDVKNHIGDQLITICTDALDTTQYLSKHESAPEVFSSYASLIEMKLI